jgi:hypothetical protein
MKEHIASLKNEDGAAILVALMILMVVTIIGVSSSKKTTMELQVVRNDGVYKQNFYQAEGAANEAIQRIWEKAQEDPYELHDKTSLPWLHDLIDVDADDDDQIDMINPGYAWDYDGEDDNDNSDTSDTLQGTILSAVDTGISSTGSLEMTGTSVHDYAVFGMSAMNSGRAFIQIGWRIRY